MIITFSFPLALAAAAFGSVTHWAWIAAPAVLAVRWFVAWRSAILLGQRDRRYLAWLPVRDLLSLAVWTIGLFGRRVPLARAGVPSRPRRPAGTCRRDSVARWIARPLDPPARCAFRRKQGIFEFDQDPRVPAAGEPRASGNGYGVFRWHACVGRRSCGDCPSLERTSADDSARRRRPALGDGHAAIDAIHVAQLAAAAQNDPRLRRAKAFGGTALFTSRGGPSQVAKMASRFGFEWVADNRKPSVLRRIHDFFQNFLVFGLQWAFNPAGLRGKGFLCPRELLYMSRETLLERYDQAAKEDGAVSAVAQS